MTIMVPDWSQWTVHNSRPGKARFSRFAVVCNYGGCFFFLHVNLQKKIQKRLATASPTMGLPGQENGNFHGFTLHCRVSVWILFFSIVWFLRAHARGVVVLASSGETLCSGLGGKSTLFIILRTRGLIAPYIHGLIVQLMYLRYVAARQGDEKFCDNSVRNSPRNSARRAGFCRISVGVVLANEPRHSIVAETDDAETEHDGKQETLRRVGDLRISVWKSHDSVGGKLVEINFFDSYFHGKLKYFLVLFTWEKRIFAALFDYNCLINTWTCILNGVFPFKQIEFSDARELVTVRYQGNLQPLHFGYQQTRTAIIEHICSLYILYETFFPYGLMSLKTLNS